MISLRVLFIAVPLFAISIPCIAAPLAQHVVVIGVDGLTAKSVEKADTPNMHALMKSGSYTLAANSVMPTVSGPNWGAILMGSEPAVNGIHDNEWKLDKNNPFPTIFRALRTSNPGATIIAAYEWLDFGRLFTNQDVTQRVNAIKSALQKDTSENAAAHYIAGQAARLIQEKKPQLIFIHLDMIDHAGHTYIYDSDKYNSAVGEVDGLVGAIVKAVDAAGIRENTALFVIADHGGKNTGHGGDTPEEKTVPWIVSGAGVVQGAAIPNGISVAQTSPTIAALLGIAAPKQWTAKPVTEVLKK